ncbi:carboxylesterase/lipase family protein [Nocardia sp. IFM 10818]
MIDSRPAGHTLTRRRFLGAAGTVAASVALGTACGSGSASDAATVATTQQGKVRGVESEGVIIWKGIPFAAPPTGPRRFAAPEPAEPWTGIREATEFGPAAPQGPLAPGTPATPNQSEDCLYLNVWSRATSGKRPVIVWIHGGAFVVGTGGDTRFDGRHFVDRDCVLVTINYRLGAFGCLYQPGKPGSGNLRLLDQMAALNWVRNNISGFGGDPDNVTVIGESAGAMSIGPLLGIQVARRLFHRAILSSGGPRPVRTPEFAALTTTAVLRTLGLSDPARLMDVSTAELLDASVAARANAELLEPYPHVIDGIVLTDHPLRTVDGSVDLLIGTCAKEADLFLIDPANRTRFETQARRAVGDRTWDHLLRTYTGTPIDGHVPLNDILSGWFAVMPSVWLAEHAQRAGAKVWQYTFDYAAAGPRGAVHGADVPYSFGNLDTAELTNPAVAEKLSGAMVSAFTAFAHTGDPAVPDLPAWPSFTPDNRACMSFDAQPRLTDDRLPAERRQAWAAADPYLVC